MPIVGEHSLRIVRELVAGHLPMRHPQLLADLEPILRLQLLLGLRALAAIRVAKPFRSALQCFRVLENARLLLGVVPGITSIV